MTRINNTQQFLRIGLSVAILMVIMTTFFLYSHHVELNRFDQFPESSSSSGRGVDANHHSPLQLLKHHESKREQIVQDLKEGKTPASDLVLRQQRPIVSKTSLSNTTSNLKPAAAVSIPETWKRVLERAKAHKKTCDGLDLPVSEYNTSIVDGTDLTDFGVIDAIETYPWSDTNSWPECQVPPPSECQETQFTVIFLGHRADRVGKMRHQVAHMVFNSEQNWKGQIKEAILVWNSENDLAESEDGQTLLKWHNDAAVPFRVYYPLKLGFPNDLLNRYHPKLNVTTKAILYYDDDGPFYRIHAVTSGFELWKRNSNAQIGAMARVLDVCDRQLEEKHALIPPPSTDEYKFISQCRSKGDRARYNFQHFANFGANMALPSGSFLHSNYLCFIWHPVLEDVRQFVRDHPVHPDDITVSTIVSHVAGRAPKVYSRRVNFPESKPKPAATHRRLLWDDGDAGVWAKKRESAVNSLLAFFGSINSGANGWCFDTPYHNKNKAECNPWMATDGMLPWMKDKMHGVDQCP